MVYFNDDIAPQQFIRGFVLIHVALMWNKVKNGIYHLLSYVHFFLLHLARLADLLVLKLLFRVPT